MWRSLVAHFVRDEGAAGSNPVIPIKDNQGERHLLDVGELSSNLSKLRKMFDMLEQKSVLMQLLDISSHADGIQIFIGGESELLPYEDLAVISAPYSVDGKIVGTLGVIGPTRMAYDRVIPIVDITSKLLSGALSTT